MVVTKETLIGEILDADMEVAPFFLNMGKHCLGCPASRMESIEEACMVHGVDPDELGDELNAYFESKKEIMFIITNQIFSPIILRE